MFAHFRTPPNAPSKFRTLSFPPEWNREPEDGRPLPAISGSRRSENSPKATLASKLRDLTEARSLQLITDTEFESMRLSIMSSFVGVGHPEAPPEIHGAAAPTTAKRVMSTPYLVYPKHSSGIAPSSPQLSTRTLNVQSPLIAPRMPAPTVPQPILPTAPQSPRIATRIVTPASPRRQASVTASAFAAASDAVRRGAPPLRSPVSVTASQRVAPRGIPASLAASPRPAFR